MSKIYVVDPASTEWNRGSFCYLPYLFVECLRDTADWEDEYVFLENYIAPDIVKIDKGCQVFVALWSPTQRDICLELYRTIPNVEFFGYKGLVVEAGLPFHEVHKSDIYEGMRQQGDSFEQYQSVLLSDCDSHIKGKFKEKFYPFHTSYGCPRGCSFCPSSKNCGGEWLPLAIPDVINKILKYKQKGYHNIHFTDEDFFMDIKRAYTIILLLTEQSTKWNLIALAHADSLFRFCRKYGEGLLHQAGFKLLEVGFEGINLQDEKGPEHINTCVELHKRLGDLVYWLTLTFAPGESIKSLNETGKFLRQYGKNPDDLLPRLRTNGTVGGLGQFFQAYPDLYRKDKLYGKHSPFNATRLFPSYIPLSFLACKIEEVNYNPHIISWAHLYNIPSWSEGIMKDWKGLCVEDVIRKNASEDTYIQTAELSIYIAIAARLGIIK